MSDITLRTTFNMKDLSEIVRVENECFPPHIAYSPEYLKSQFGSAESIFFIAESRGKIVGFVLANTKSRKPSGWISSLNVATEFRRQGLGARLLLKAEAALKAQGCMRIVLDVGIDNGSAIKLYEKSGYKRLGQKHNYYGAGRHAFEMAKDL